MYRKREREEVFFNQQPVISLSRPVLVLHTYPSHASEIIAMTEASDGWTRNTFLHMPADRSDKESYIEGILYSKQRDGQKMRWDKGGVEGNERGSDISRENENSAATSFSFPADALKSCLPFSSPHPSRSALPHPATTSPHHAALGHLPPPLSIA